MENTGLRERKKERTRATIARVALELFARDGFAATTLSAIAEAADVSPRTVSTYFPSKEGIVFAVYPDAIERLGAAARQSRTWRKSGRRVGEWARVEASLQDEVARGASRARVTDGTDFARLRQAAIARDPGAVGARAPARAAAGRHAHGRVRRRVGRGAGLAAGADRRRDHRGRADGGQCARRERRPRPSASLLETVLDFIGGGVSAVEK